VYIETKQYVKPLYIETMQYVNEPVYIETMQYVKFTVIAEKNEYFIPYPSIQLVTLVLPYHINGLDLLSLRKKLFIVVSA